MNKLQIDASTAALVAAARKADSRDDMADLLLGARREVLEEAWTQLAGKPAPRGLDDVVLVQAMVDAVWGLEDE